MPPMTPTQETKLARQLILDELFDLSLYRKLREIGGPELHKTLDELIAVEARHFAFWEAFFKIEVTSLDTGRRLKLWFIAQVCRLFGSSAIDLVLEAIEVYGVRKYLTLWDRYKDKPLGAALRDILRDEFEHEDAIVSRLKVRLINPDRIRNIFLGLNDGLVEILGAVSGFFASLGQSGLVLIAGLTTAVAGSLSMAAGAFVATSSENEVRRTQEEKAHFLEESVGPAEKRESALRTALIVGVSYFIGASFPLLPVLLGARTPSFSIFTGGTTVILVSMILAFLSGMDVKKRVLMNLILVTAAVGITYGIGLLVRDLFGVNLG
jgi:predicted membrane protein (TIGR00267 family)